MGLDVTAFLGLREAPADADDTVRFFDNQHFPGRIEGVKGDTPYAFVASGHVSASSYSGYNRWREWLAAVAGVAKIEAFWDAYDPAVPFAELLHFADNEGTLGPVVCARLAADFERLREKARTMEPDGSGYFDRYEKWALATRLAGSKSAPGAIQFH